MKATILMVGAVLLATPAVAQMKAKADAKKDLTASAELKDAQGKTVGTAKLKQTPNGVMITLEVTGVPEGPHAFHIHEKGVCEPPFKSAGGHYNPRHKQHGVENAKGMHAGDFPNLQVPKSGELKVTLFTDEVTLKKGRTTLFDKDGSALVLHAGADDYSSDPAGNAGDRYACGVVKK